MDYLYSNQAKQFKSGRKVFWGSLHGSAQVLSLIEFVNKEQQVVLVIANDITHFNYLYQSFNFYNNGLSILKFDSWEVLPYDNFSPNPNIIASRLNTLSKLENLNSGIVISTLESLLSWLCPIGFNEQYSFNLSVGDIIDLSGFSEKLLKIGYNRVATVMEHGEFNVRGSIIDLYPIGGKIPYRIDLFDKEVDSIRTFDALTQRSENKKKQIFIFPAKEFAADTTSIELFKHNYQQKFSNKSLIFSEVSEGRLPGGIEFYLPLFFNHTNSLFDYLNQNAVIVTQAGFTDLVDDAYQQIHTRFEHAKTQTERPPLEINTVFLKKELLFSNIKQHTQLVISSATLEEKNQHFNFSTKLLPALRITPQTKKPLIKFYNFVKRFNKKILIVCESLGRQNILIELLSNNDLKVYTVKDWNEFINSVKPINITHKNLDNGLLTNDIAVISEQDLFGKQVAQQKRRRISRHKDFEEAIKNLIEIKIKDPVVHENYGVGRYLGLKTQIFDDKAQDFLQLEYANNAKLMVPVASLNLISRYSGVSAEHAPLHQLGSNQWSTAKKKAGEALHDVAAELLAIYAKRKSQQGFAFDAPNDAYSSFVADFAFEETAEQSKTMSEVLIDMQSHKPMDRLICGDVGFGKTEIAMRAAFLAVESGKQVAMLVPTTLLTNQHHQSFIDRFIKYPVEIAALSRFQTAKQQKIIEASLSKGQIDIVIGTHKIIQDNIKYKNLGLIIIDEEHRFGVKQKEALKKIRHESDILSMTATPIPRTLNMALGSLREISIITTPPAKRTAIRTFVQVWDDENIKEACARELHRAGQIFVLHNDIDSIDNMAENLIKIMPNVQIRIAHGKIPTRELEQIMNDFYHARFQILICTTIIETGIDIPNANTIIINNAQNFGLAQLHQLRGRVGRSHHQAYAYLIIKSHQSLSKDAQKRLDAIQSLKELGSGFMLANHDLEIRGAGDLLGDNQSGKIADIGFNLYQDLLKRTVNAIRLNEKVDLDEHHEIQIDSGLPSIIPENYLHDVHKRLVLYKRIASCNNDDELKELQIEMIDHFGLLPDSTKNLFANTNLKLFAKKIGVKRISMHADKAIIMFDVNNAVKQDNIINLIQKSPKLYQLKKGNQLIYKTQMAEDISRIETIKTFLKTLS